MNVRSDTRKIRDFWLMVAASEKGICAIAPSLRSKRESEERFRRCRLPLESPASDGGGGVTSSETAVDATIAEAFEQLAQYFDGRRRIFDLPLDLSAGTDFQQAVWRGCREVAFGATESYGGLARRIGRPGAMRAVGGALGANPIPIVVPCHRIVRSDGALGGFGGGLDMKRRLLDLEGVGPT